KRRLRLLGAAGVGQSLDRLGPWRLDELLEFAAQSPPIWVEVSVDDDSAGGKRSIEIVPQPVGDPSRPRATVLGLRDITRRRLAEGRILLVGHDLTPLREAQERAMQSERLAAIGQMTTGLGHESRNALQRCQAAIDRLRLRIADRPDLMEFVDQLESAQEHLL